MNLSRRLLSSFKWTQVLTLGAMVACGDAGDGSGGSDTDASTSDPTSSSGGSDGSALEGRLSGCPILSTSSDPSAGACLAGTYEGKTPSGEACSLELGEAGVYEFTSPTLSVSHDVVPDKTIFVYDHSVVGNYELLAWKVSDPLTVETWYELSFDARFGAGVPETDSRIQIDVTEHAENSTKSASCTVDL